MRKADISDWTEDAERYEQQCVMCRLTFYGHKYRRVCRMCAHWPPWRWQAYAFRLLGIVPPGMARVMQFTHHARLFGVLPCYYRDDPPDSCVLEMKWRPLWLVEFPLRYIWLTVWAISRDDPPNFGISVGKQL